MAKHLRTAMGLAMVLTMAPGTGQSQTKVLQDDWGDDWGDGAWEDESWEDGSWEDESWDDEGWDDGGWGEPEAPVPAAATQALEDTSTDLANQTTPAARYLQEGLQYYERDEFYTASVFFWRVVNDTEPEARGLRPRAQYELAKTLVRLGLLQGALYYFDEIIGYGEAHPYFEASAPWMVVIARRLPGDPEMLRRVASFAGVFPDRIEGKYRDEMAFMLGQHYFNVGELERALQYLGFVTEVSSYYPKALFYAGITHVRLFQAEPALGRFVRLREAASRNRGDDELERLADLATVSMARTYYSAGDYNRAIQFYAEIDQESDYWLPALFESSWAYFQQDRYNRALGNLHSLNSPFFNDQYYPEAPILQAVIFFMNCRFAKVRETLDEFVFTYQPIREELEARLAELRTNNDYYNFLVRVSDEQERDFDPKLQSIVNATLNDRTIRLAMEFLEEIDRELEFLENADAGWANSELAQYLAGEILATRELSANDAGALVRARLNTVRDDLLAQERNANAILVEADLAEADSISADLRRELFSGEAADLQRREPTAEEMYWTFDGEYWKDELGFYYYRVTSVCQ